MFKGGGGGGKPDIPDIFGKKSYVSPEFSAKSLPATYRIYVLLIDKDKQGCAATPAFITQESGIDPFEPNVSAALPFLLH